MRKGIRNNGFLVMSLIFLITLNFNQVLAQMTILPETLPDAVLGESYRVYLYTEPPMAIDTWEIASGSLPPGLTLRKSDSYKGLISGTPSSTGTYSFTVRAIKFPPPNQPGKPIIIYKSYEMNVVGIYIYPSTLPEATENSSYSASLWVRGGTPPYSWDVTGLSTERTNITWQLAPRRTDQIIISGTP